MPGTTIAPTTIVLTEETLDEGDAQRIVGLHTPDSIHYRILVPADVRRNLLADVLDHLSLFELHKALDAARGDDDDSPTRTEASVALAQSVRAFDAAIAGRPGPGGASSAVNTGGTADTASPGSSVDGAVVQGDPLDALQQAVKSDPQSAEVVVVTRPHAVEDTFHRDWASRARDLLGLPVLHIYAGLGYVG